MSLDLAGPPSWPDVAARPGTADGAGPGSGLAGGGNGAVSGRARPGTGHRDQGTPLPPAPSPEHRAAMAAHWPVRDFLELGALPGAVPSARLHARQVLWEWGLASRSEPAELVLSELVTNAVDASRSPDRVPVVRLWLLSAPAPSAVLVLVWDANPRLPQRLDPAAEAENGRGLLLVEAASARWGSYATPNLGGKAVWALIDDEARETNPAGPWPG